MSEESRPPMAYWKREKTYRLVSVICTYNLENGLRASRIKFPQSDDEWIVGTDELISEAQMTALRLERERQQNLDYLLPIIQAVKAGADTPQKVAASMGVPFINVVSKYKLAKRLLLI